MSECPLCGAPCSEDVMRTHLRESHPHESWGPYASNQVTMDGRTVIGIPRRIAYALYIWPHDSIPRALIRAMLPERGRKRKSSGQRHSGNLYATHSATSKKFGQVLYDLDGAGVISREGDYVRIVDRENLRRRALDGISGEGVEFLAIEQAVEPAREAVRQAERAAQRERALRDLQDVYDLMNTNLGTFHSGKGSVRHVPTGWRGRPS